jgi:hypothetical protein
VEEKREMMGCMEEVKRERASKQESCGDQRKNTSHEPVLFIYRTVRRRPGHQDFSKYKYNTNRGPRR